MAFSDADLRRLLAQNEALMRRADKQDRAIRWAANDELGRIDARLRTMPAGRVARDSALAFEYRRLVEEKARLMRLVAQ